MKRTRKQFLALLLAFAMAFSLLPAPALASEEEGASENAFDGITIFEETETAAAITETGTYIIWADDAAAHWLHYTAASIGGCGGKPSSHVAKNACGSAHEWVITPALDEDGAAVENGFTLKSVAAEEAGADAYVTVNTESHALEFGTEDAAAVFTIIPPESGNNYTFQWNDGSTDYYLAWQNTDPKEFILSTAESTVRLFQRQEGAYPIASIPGYTRVTTADGLVDGSYLVVAPADNGNYYVLRPHAWSGTTGSNGLPAMTYQLTLDDDRNVTGVTGTASGLTLADMHYTISGGRLTAVWKITHGDSLSFYPTGTGHNLWHTTNTATCGGHAGTPIAYTDANGGSFRIRVSASGVHLLLNSSTHTFTGSSTISGQIVDFLFFKVDKTALAEAVEEAEALAENDYTAASWAAFSTALEGAAAVNDNLAATPEEVIEAVDALQAAAGALVNISELKAAIELADNLCNSGSGTYTPESLQALSDALDSARAANTSDATQKAVDAAAAGIQEAVNGLVFISTPTDLTLPGYERVSSIPEEGLTDGYYLLVVAHDDGNGTKSYYTLYPGGEGSSTANARKIVVSDSLMGTGLCNSDGDAAAPVAFANAHNHITRVPSDAEDVTGIQYYMTAIKAPDVMTQALRTVYEFAIDTEHELYHVRATVCPGDYISITKDDGEDTFSFRGYSGQYFGLNSSGPKFGCDISASGLECGVMLFRYTGVEKTYLLREVNFVNAANPQEAHYTAATWEALQKALTAANEVLDNDKATQKDVDAALNNLATAWTNLAVHDPRALPGYTHKTDTDFSPAKRYLVVSWSSAEKPYALYFDNHDVGAGALLTTNVETATTNVAPITLTGADETLAMTFDKGSEAAARFSILSDGQDRYYVRNGDNYFSLGDHVYEEIATTVGITQKSDNSFLLSGTPSSGSDRYLSLNVHGDAACSKNNWKNLATGFWGPTDAAVVEFPVFIYESEEDFDPAALPTGAAISAQMMNNGDKNTWVFTGGRGTEGAYEDVGLSRTAVSAFEEYVRWTNTSGSGDQGTVRQRYVFNLGYTGQTLAEVVSSFDTRIKPLKPKAVVYAAGAEDLTADASAIETFKTNLGSFIDKALTVRNTGNTTEDTYAIIVKPYQTADNGAEVAAVNAAIEAVMAEKAADEATAAKIQVVASADFSGDNGTYINEEGYPTAKGQLNLSYRFAKAVVGYTGAENAYPVSGDYTGLYTTNWPGELVTGTAGEVTLDAAYQAARDALKAKVDNKDEPMTWLFMGDSITHGAAWSEGQDTISQVFEKFVKHDLGRKRDIVLNTAVSSATTDTTWAHINERLNNYDPDVVSIMIGTNDAANHLVNTTNYKANLIRILDAIFAKEGTIVVLRTPIPNGANNRGNYIYEYVTAMKEVVAGLSADKKDRVIVVDQFPEWVPYMMTSDTGTGTTFLFGKVFTKDGNKIHPGPVGHLWMTQELIRDMGLSTDSTICKLHYHDTGFNWGITETTSTQSWADYVKYDASSHTLTVPVSVFNNGGTVISATVTATVDGKTYTGTAARGSNVIVDLSEAVAANADAAQNVTLAATALVSVSASAGRKVTFQTLNDLDLTSGPAIPEVAEPPAGAALYAGGDERLLPPNHNQETTNGQPYNEKTNDRVGVAGSRHFRIPALITLKHQKDETLNGRLVAAMDARWTHTDDAYGLDTLVAYSSNDGETWNHTYANYFADSIYVDNSTTLMDPRRATVFIDPVLAEDLDGTIYLMTDLFPGGVATLGSYGVTPAIDTGYRNIALNGVTKQRMILYTMTDGAYTDTTRDPTARPQTADNWTFFIGDFEGPEGGDKYATIYNNRCKPTELYVDEYYYLYKKASVEAERDPDNDRIYCPQILNPTSNNTKGWASNSKDSYIQQNVFFYNSILHVRCASYLWVVKSTDGGTTWSKPDILNPQVRYNPAQDQFYGVGPGAGLTLEYGPLKGMVLLPTYIHGGTAGEIAEFIYTRDNGATWGRSQRATNHGTGTGANSSESCLVQIGDTTVRHFYRDSTSLLNYTDHEWNGTQWVAGAQHTVYAEDGSGVAKANDTQLSAILYSKKIDGKDAIILSTATGPSGKDRRTHGCVYVLLMEDAATDPNRTMTRAYTYEVNGVGEGYAYSSLSEMANGDIALLYENSGQKLNSCNPFVIIPIEDIADGAMLSDGTTAAQRLSVPIYDTLTVALSEEGRAAMQTQLADSEKVVCTVNSADGTVTLAGRASGSETVTYTSRNNQAVTITVAVEGTGNTQEVAMTLPDYASMVVHGLPAGALVGYNSNPDAASAEMEQHNETVSITDGAKAKRFGANAYNGDTVNLVDCLYTFTNAGTANQYYIQNIKYPALFLNLATAARRPNGVKGAIKMADGTDSKIAISAAVNGGTTYLYFGTTNDTKSTPHFDRNGGSPAASNYFYLYRPAGEGDTASTEIPGFVKLQNIGEIKSGKQYLVVSKIDEAYYVLYPSAANDDFASGALVNAADKSNQSHTWGVDATLTITGKAAGTTVVMAGGTRYDVTVIDGRQVVSGVSIAGIAQVDQTLTANVTLSDDGTVDDTKVTYAWYTVDNGTETVIASATGSTYTPAVGDVGKQIKVTVTAKADEGYVGSATSALTAPVAAAGVVVTNHAVTADTTPQNGTIAVSAATAAQGAQIIITLTPAEGYKVAKDSLKVYQTGDETVTVAVTDNHFTMPDYDVTVTAQFEPLTDLSDALAAVESAAYTATQAACANQNAAQEAIKAAVAALELPEGVTAAVNFGTYNAPVAGTADNTSGTDGAYTFTVMLTHEDGAAATTKTLTLVITATAYVAPSEPSSSGSSSGSSTTTKTTKNEDGSTTTTVTNHRTGTVTETTEKMDGTVEVVETKKDGTVTTTVTEPDGTVTEAVSTPEGAVTTTAKTPDGIVVKADTTAETEDATVSIAVPTTILAANVSIPVGINYSTVAVDAQGNIVNLSVPTEDLTAMKVRVEGSIDLTLVKRDHGFVDIDGHWAEDSITFAAAHEFVNGTSETEFTPEGEMTRGMMFTLLARMNGVDTTGGETWYAKGSQWAVEERLSDGTNLESNITREQLATLLWRYVGRPEVEGELNFADADEVSDFAVEAMRWAVEKGIFEGTDNGELRSKDNATRAQAAAVLLRFCRLLMK